MDGNNNNNRWGQINTLIAFNLQLPLWLYGLIPGSSCSSTACLWPAPQQGCVCVWEGGSGQGVRSVGLLYWQQPETVRKESIYLFLPTMGMEQQGTTGSRTQPRWVSAESRHTHICARGGICAHAHPHPRTHTVLALKLNWPTHTHRSHKHPYSHRHNLDTFLGVMKHMLTCWADRRQLGSGPYLAFPLSVTWSEEGVVTVQFHLMTFITLIIKLSCEEKLIGNSRKEVIFLFIQ